MKICLLNFQDNLYIQHIYLLNCNLIKKKLGNLPESINIINLSSLNSRKSFQIQLIPQKNKKNHYNIYYDYNFIFIKHIKVIPLNKQTKKMLGTALNYENGES